MRRLLPFVFALTAIAQQPVQIHVDLTRSLGAYHPVTNWFGYDELNYTTTPHGRQLLGELHDLSPVPVYIRAHHLFTTGDGVPALKWSSTNILTLDSAGKPVYDFHIVDATFDAWRDAGVRPMVELGFMPEALASGTQPYHQPYPHTTDGSLQSPPRDYAAWQELCRVFTAHLIERYGRATVAQWYFEVWNEPDIFYWHATPAEYFRLYDFAVAGVRSALPEARVGGPASTSPRAPHALAFLHQFLDHIAHETSAADSKPVPLDFISFHVKGQPKLIPAADGTPTHVRMGLDKELTDIDKGFALIASYPQFKPLPIILSEADPEGCAACSAVENPANAYRNGPLFPAYTAASLKALLDLQAKHGVNLLGMLTWSFEFEVRKYFEGFRTLATNGVDKPILNVFRMAGMLGGDRVATTSTGAPSLEALVSTGVPATTDVDSMATLNGHTASILLWNYQDDDLPAPASPVTLTVTGIPASVQSVRLQQFRIDATHSNAFTVWKSMGSPQQPTTAQQARLVAAGKLEALAPATTVRITNGKLTLPFELPRQATSLLRLGW